MPTCYRCSRYSEKGLYCYARFYCTNCAHKCDYCHETFTFNSLIIEYNENRQKVYFCEQCWHNSNCWNAVPFNPQDPSYTIIGSRRRFGVEIETSHCPNYRITKGRFPFGAKFDGSIRGMEFVSDILYADSGLQAVINFCQTAQKLNWRTNSDCGLHIHCDMSSEDNNALRNVAYAYLLTDQFWRTFVNQYRANDCNYCKTPEYDSSHIRYARNWHNFCRDVDRYTLCNINAYNRYGSYEIRLHQGSLNGRVISAWIRVHLRFIDAMCQLPTMQDVRQVLGLTPLSQWYAFKQIVRDPYLIRFYGRHRSQGLQQIRRPQFNCALNYAN